MVTFITATVVILGIAGWVYVGYEFAKTKQQQRRLQQAMRDQEWNADYLTWISK